MNPVLVSIAGFDIHYYSVLILIAIIVAGVGIVGQARRWHIPKQFITNMMFWVLILSIIISIITKNIFTFKLILYYLLIFLTGIIGSTIGINLSKK